MSRSIKDKVEELAKPVVEMQGLELVDIEYQKEGDDWVLRVYIDHEAGISLGNCEKVSKALSNKLDVEDPIGNSYLLEVSSPGIDRPLKKEEDFVRFSGSLIDISTYAPIKGEKKLTAKLLGIDNDNLKIEYQDEELSIPRNKIAQVRLAVEF